MQNEPLTRPALSRPALSRRTFLAATAAAGAMTLGGCSALLPSGGPQPRTFTLSPKTLQMPAVDGMPPVAWQLVVEPPYAAQALNTPRMMLLIGTMQFDQYARASWSDRAPVLVQDMLVQSFDKTGKIRGVGRETLGMKADFALRTELRDFQGEVISPKQHRIRVQLAGRLIRLPGRVVVGSQAFEATVDVDPTLLENVVMGFDEALGQVMKRLVEWTLVTGEANKPRVPVTPAS